MTPKLYTLLLNANYQPRAVIPIARAFALQFEDGSLGSGLGRVDVVLNALQVAPDQLPAGARVWRTPQAAYPIPLVVALRRMESPLFDLHNAPAGRPNLRTLIRRDRGHCLYCLRSKAELSPGEGFTIDHIIPQSHFRRRGDAHTWENVALSCLSCNQRKMDRTPEQAGMTLHGVPLEPSRWELVAPRLLPCQRAFVRWMRVGGAVPPELQVA